LNLLKRINNELGGDFNIDKFRHVPEYNVENGMALSYLESTADQLVNINATGKTYNFYQGERIHTEISRKYDLNDIAEIAKDTGLIVKQTFYDNRKYFVDVLFEKESDAKRTI
jgi:uncharacterized SAM-dependent methyltransferase